eukprot:m.9091 g.9091  ORF g.9091 m.9091 type:complete len:56 (-) comp3403_c0_seq1:1318-1485(-)
MAKEYKDMGDDDYDGEDLPSYHSLFAVTSDDAAPDGHVDVSPSWVSDDQPAADCD